MYAFPIRATGHGVNKDHSAVSMCARTRARQLLCERARSLYVRKIRFAPLSPIVLAHRELFRADGESRVASYFASYRDRARHLLPRAPNGRRHFYRAINVGRLEARRATGARTRVVKIVPLVSRTLRPRNCHDE